MWNLGPRFQRGLAYSELTLGLDDLRGLSQPEQFCDSVTASSAHLAHPVPTLHAHHPQGTKTPSAHPHTAQLPSGRWSLQGWGLHGVGVPSPGVQWCMCSAHHTHTHLGRQGLTSVTALPLPLLLAGSPRHTEILQRVFNRGVAGWNKAVRCQRLDFSSHLHCLGSRADYPLSFPRWTSLRGCITSTPQPSDPYGQTGLKLCGLLILTTLGTELPAYLRETRGQEGLFV